jgi:hypothetical protein
MLWAGYLSINVFVNTLGMMWVSVNIRFLLLILWVWDGCLSIFVFVNYLGVLNFREYRRYNQKGQSKRAIQRNWQYRVHKTKKKTQSRTKYVLDTSMHKQTHTHTHTHTHTPQTIYAPPPPQATGGKNELNIVLMRKS